MHRTDTKVASRFGKKWLVLLVFALFLLGIGAFAYHQENAKKQYHCTAKKQPFAHTACQFPQNSPNLDIRLAWEHDDTPIFTFKNLLRLSPDTTFAMNAGMYNNKYAPIGYTVIDGQEILSLNLKDGAGNFHLMPNGVFWHGTDGFYISESKTMNALLQQGTHPIFATQSGPMLVIDGQIHPKFDPNSTSFKIRNGVGVCGERLEFVISDEPVNFYQFAQLFKDELNCQNALFLDGGTASALYSKELLRSDSKNMGVMIVVDKK